AAVPFRRTGCAWQLWNGATTAAAAFDVPRQGQLIGLEGGAWYATLGAQGQTVVARGRRNLVLDRGAPLAHGGVPLYGALAVDGNIAVVGWNVYGAKRHGQGEEANPNGGAQNEHEEPSFALVRLVTM